MRASCICMFVCVQSPAAASRRSPALVSAQPALRVPALFIGRPLFGACAVKSRACSDGNEAAMTLTVTGVTVHSAVTSCALTPVTVLQVQLSACRRVRAGLHRMCIFKFTLRSFVECITCVHAPCESLPCRVPAHHDAIFGKLTMASIAFSPADRIFHCVQVAF